MMERSPQILARAIGMLPPAQDPGIVLGEERYGGEQVHMDLLAYGRVVGPHDEHLAAQAAGTVGRWEEAWKSGDLLIHDFSFVAAIRSMDPDFLFAEEVATEAIWRLLNGEPVLDGDGQPVVRPPVHQGPVGCLRMVLAPPPAQEVGVVWMRRIRELRGEDGLRELVVFNTNRPVTEAFPLRALPAGLRTLALGFFTLHLHKPIERLARLTQLSLTGCAFSGQALSSLLPYLYSLRILALGSCNITAHCGPEGLTIVSSSLVRLNMWSCTASGGVSLQYTPRMAHFSVGVRPEHAGNARLHIQIRTAGALRELDGLMMHRHDLSYLVPYKQEKVQGRWILPLQLLSKLGVYIQMSGTTQLVKLLELLHRIPRLSHLYIMRIDSVTPLEEAPGQELFTVPCITNCLRFVTLQNFRGGAADTGFLERVIFEAQQLTEVEIHPHRIMTAQAAVDAIATLHVCPRASPDVHVVLAP